MYVCMYACMHVCMYVYVRINVSPRCSATLTLHLQTNIHTCIHTYINFSPHPYHFAQPHLQTYTQTYIHTCIHKFFTSPMRLCSATLKTTRVLLRLRSIMLFSLRIIMTHSDAPCMHAYIHTYISHRAHTTLLSHTQNYTHASQIAEHNGTLRCTVQASFFHVPCIVVMSRFPCFLIHID